MKDMIIPKPSEMRKLMSEQNEKNIKVHLEAVVNNIKKGAKKGQDHIYYSSCVIGKEKIEQIQFGKFGYESDITKLVEVDKYLSLNNYTKEKIKKILQDNGYRVYERSYTMDLDISWSEKRKKFLGLF